MTCPTCGARKRKPRIAPGGELAGQVAQTERVLGMVAGVGVVPVRVLERLEALLLMQKQHHQNSPNGN